MKKFFLILLILMINFGNVIKAESTANEKRTYERLIASIAYIESKHDPSLVSKNKRYVGYLQISEICVREANNIIGYKKYKYSDRLDMNKSIEIFHIIQNHHNPKQDLYLAIRIWNEGISAKNKKPMMTPYLRKVMNLYNTKFKHLDE